MHRRGGIYYAQLLNPTTGHYMSARSTGQTSKDEAILAVADWLRTGAPAGRQRVTRPMPETWSMDALLGFIRSSAFGMEDAARVVEALQTRGLLDGGALRGSPGSEDFSAYLRRFWNYEKSPYRRELEAHGRALTKGHCLNCLQRAEKFWIPWFKGKRLAEITKSDFRATAHELITENPAEGVMRFSRAAQEARGSHLRRSPRALRAAMGG